MIGAVHAGIGAAIGSLFSDKKGAFAAGVASHILADVLPHKDFKPKTEAPLLIAMLVAIAAWRGTGSTEFWGAMGAVSPDVEHALLVAGVIGPEREIFPTHIDDGRYHGPDSGERWSQLALLLVSIATVALSD